MKLMIFTQVHENYGSESDPYWKPKGGDDYFVPVSMDDLLASEDKAAFLRGLVDAARAVIEQRNCMFEEYIIDWSLEDDSFRTEFESSQLEWDGCIMYPSKPVHVERGVAALVPVYMQLEAA